jgi:serine O-acetyltransferase
LGQIEIGNDAAIGANAVVTKSLPDRAVAIGIPAYVISYEGSFEFIAYINMENDPTRAESLLLRDQK